MTDPLVPSSPRAETWALWLCVCLATAALVMIYLDRGKAARHLDAIELLARDVASRNGKMPGAVVVEPASWPPPPAQPPPAEQTEGAGGGEAAAGPQQ